MAVYKQKEREKNATIGKDGYPIGDKTHAEKALQFIDRGGLDSAEKAKVRRKAARFGVGTGTSTKKKKSKPDRKMKHLHD